ncbi:MAG: sn-glycerol-3-phosphate ABC transporter ATP-binding protein UgpC [Desulfobacterales bacterium]|nr:sn-glycerol-3-phosphate ABC transporter ATP-binding protein UgpC [Desulfobacterales bacterium]
MASLTLRNITKQFGATTALDDVSFTVADSEFVVLVGPSGCGKSTLLRLIAGLDAVSAGEILLADTLVNDVPPKDRDIAMVFQNYALYPHMTVFANMAFGLKMRGMARKLIRKRVLEAARILGLEQLLARRSNKLSGGQQQRVALGRAIVRNPRLFLFDEPLSNLDARLRVAMRAELIRLHQRLGATMIYVTHDQSEAMSMGDRLVVLKDGRVQQIGAPLAIYHRPANLFVAGFIGNPPMNFFYCTVLDQGSGPVLQGDSFSLPLPAAMRKKLESAALDAGEIVLGIRPEDILESGTGRDSGSALPVMARVEFLEVMGNEILATCRLGDQGFIARLSPQTAVKANAEVFFSFALDRALFFDPRTGESIQ